MGNLKRKFLICTVDFQECLGLLQHLGPSFGQGEWVNKIFWSHTTPKNKHTQIVPQKKRQQKTGNFAKLSRHQPKIQKSFVILTIQVVKPQEIPHKDAQKKTHVLPQKMHKNYHTSHHHQKKEHQTKNAPQQAKQTALLWNLYKIRSHFSCFFVLYFVFTVATSGQNPGPKISLFRMPRRTLQIMMAQNWGLQRHCKQLLILRQGYIWYSSQEFRCPSFWAIIRYVFLYITWNFFRFAIDSRLLGLSSLLASLKRKQGTAGILHA